MESEVDFRVLHSNDWTNLAMRLYFFWIFFEIFWTAISFLKDTGTRLTSVKISAQSVPYKLALHLCGTRRRRWNKHASHMNPKTPPWGFKNLHIWLMNEKFHHSSKYFWTCLRKLPPWDHHWENIPLTEIVIVKCTYSYKSRGSAKTKTLKEDQQTQCCSKCSQKCLSEMKAKFAVVIAEQWIELFRINTSFFTSFEYRNNW